MNLPADTYVQEGKYFRVTESDGSSFFVEAEYLFDIPDTDGYSVEPESGTFAAVNGQDPEGNGIEEIFATEAEAEEYLRERFWSEGPPSDD